MSFFLFVLLVFVCGLWSGVVDGRWGVWGVGGVGGGLCGCGGGL